MGQTVREKCPYSVFFWFIFSAHGLNMNKNWKNSEYKPSKRSEICWKHNIKHLLPSLLWLFSKSPYMWETVCKSFFLHWSWRRKPIWEGSFFFEKITITCSLTHARACVYHGVRNINFPTILRMCKMDNS